MRALTAVLAIVVGLVLGFGSGAAETENPLRDPYLVTVIGTARADQAELPASVPERIRRVTRFPDRQPPGAFFDGDAFAYTLSAQKGEAPLMFVVAGTGASHRSSKMRFLQRVFFDTGYHVVLLSSPTAPDFLVSASEASMPGWMEADVADLYAVMQAVRDDLSERLAVSRVLLSGYSLGATQAAFLGALDEERRVFDFDRILLINPSVNLFTSVRILDGLFETGLPEGPASAERIIGRLLAEVSAYTREERGAVLDSELLYRVAERMIAEGRQPKREALQGMIAAAFRLSSANIVFTADALHGGGHVVESGSPLGVSTSLTVPFKRSARWPFERYVDEMLVPYWNGRDPALTKDVLIRGADLAAIRDFLERADHVGLVTNADDFILSEDDLAFLRETFGGRATIFPTGGHCGTLQHRDNVAAMRAFFEDARP